MTKEAPYLEPKEQKILFLIRSYWILWTYYEQKPMFSRGANLMNKTVYVV